MGGYGKRFKEAGYETYKPLLPIGDKTMIERVIENLTPSCPHRFIFIVNADFWEMVDHDPFPQDALVIVEKERQGAATAIALASEHIKGQPLVIANSDQLVDFSIDEFLEDAEPYDASILVFNDSNPKWSFAEVYNDEVIRVAEKDPISEWATVGIYYWQDGQDYLQSLEQMMEAGDKVNNEWYVCPTYNYMPRHKLITYMIVSRDEMHGLGTPEDYEAYLALVRS
jgi:dTDP-glucose pyrophosphorylase